MADRPDRVACLIVGLGPVGATLANLMGLAGIETLAVDRAPAPYDLPRAVHFDDEVMRVFQTIGVASALEPLVRFNPGMRFVAPDGSILLDWPRQRAVTPQGWLSSYRFHQPDLETV